jgi:hypothetical protein
MAGQLATGRMVLSALCVCFAVSHAAEHSHARLVVSARPKPILPLRALRGGEDPHTCKACSAGTPDQPDSAVAVKFSVECTATSIHEYVAIVGSVPELGSWSNFIPMCSKVLFTALSLSERNTCASTQ